MIETGLQRCCSLTCLEVLGAVDASAGTSLEGKKFRPGAQVSVLGFRMGKSDHNVLIIGDK